MGLTTPNHLPPEIVFKIISLSLSRTDERNPRSHRWKMRFLRTCCLVCRGWLDVCQAFLFQNVYIRRISTFILFCTALSSPRKVGKYVRKLLIALPTWEDTSPYPIHLGVEKCLALCEGLEELQVKPPFDQFFTEKSLPRIHALVHLRKFSLRRVSGLQVANIKAYSDWSVDFEAADPLDIFPKLVLPPTVQHLDLVQPPIEFMDALPKILSEVIATGSLSSLAGTSSESPRGLKSFSLQVSHVYNKDPNPNMYGNLPHIMSAQMTSFKLCLDIRLQDQEVIDILALTPHLEELKLGRISLSQFLFRHLAPLPKLRSISLVAHPAEVEAENNVEWLEFCDALTSFIEKSPLLDAFEFDTALSVHTALISLLLDLLYLTTADPSRTHSRLKHLTIKHADPPPMSSIERICERAPLLESLDIRVPVRALGRLRIALARLPHLQRLELNNFLILRRCLEQKISIEPFFRLTEQQNKKRNIQEMFAF
ncbi:hypothetical protein PCANC_27149 [Puccinia coronata f. sp. avenae]|uniref:Uncharacterized protein n=1 Tax=Puccinia coronata f. sp. avenae TaxID=200324 RepID=A0A2N5TDT7_9BASI|nr:hypothetical protein PCANC_27149 [Puccinia coronata f. sp. avenae]PLW23662.1 hypothetical protein PCASD_13562 [Puccinia coronata f. sp. avenae]